MSRYKKKRYYKISSSSSSLNNDLPETINKKKNESIEEIKWILNIRDSHKRPVRPFGQRHLGVVWI